MVVLKKLSAQLATGFLAVGALALPSPQTSSEDVAPIPAADPEDIASSFVAELISNATQIQEELESTVEKRSLLGDLLCDQKDDLVVNLGYAKYQGVANAASGVNSWKGIRFAAAPTGNLRWQPPRSPPLVLNAPVTPANSFGPMCPQSLPAVPNAPYIPGNEDCLFLNVYAPANARGLPVLVWIHGGGYGFGDGTQDMTEIINANNNGIVVVSIQYRLGAFGWLSSAEVRRKGVVNAGLLDQAFALKWIKQYICQFGGDPLSVTISGESAGAGSVMYHDVAVQGNLGSLLFDKSIAASPYLPFHYKYDDAVPTSKYYAFSAAAGCPSSGNVFDCLKAKDTNTLQEANYAVTQASAYGYWAFYPVTDNAYIYDRPTRSLDLKRVNGRKLLVGSNANEGPLFVPPTIKTQADLFGWLHVQFPNLSDAQITAILAANPNSAETDADGPKYETNGLGTGNNTAVFVSQDSNGQQQRGNNILAEATFVCPAYWMASGYTNAGNGKAAYTYQYSVPFAWHGTDVVGYFGPATPNQSPEFVKAFRQIWGNFVKTGNPSISNVVANGANAASPGAPNPASSWPTWTDNANNKLVNLNTTGGTPYETVMQWGSPVTQFSGDGIMNAFTVANANSWEGGRGARCDVYEGLAPSIPA
ncbi:acetylcholinesterase [Rhypophila decipiens]|uniref:Carboxylic ester hydrolase n=1 Tax=Rhypophila decipiens TaxID=261697 RepID=A0AAN6XY12_9PEZI|nr:acetylcholinesterase [Rhypophila decipiens]